MIGKVKWFNDVKGYGFIGRSDGPDVFVHYTALLGKGHRTLKEGDTVKFELLFDSIPYNVCRSAAVRQSAAHRYQVLGPSKPGRRGWISRGLGHGLLRQAAKSVHQLYKASTICLFYRRESQSQSTPRRNVPHYPFRPDLSFGDTKMNLGPRIDGPCLWSIEEHTPKAQVLDY